jgi:sec-independent protein translocase protein TatB
MFDVGFPELLLVSIVALLVIGPERLPETVRTIMVWLGKIKRSFANIKTEIEQEIGVDEIRQQIHNDSIMKDLDEGREKIQRVFDDIQQEIPRL